VIVTTYTCDKCRHSQEGSEQMWDIGITVIHRPQPTRYSYSREPVEKALWCRKCVESLGLLPAEKTDPPTSTPTPTFEDMIREIIQEEIEASQ